MKKIKTGLLSFIFVCFSFITTAQQYEHLIIYGQSLSVSHQSWPPLSTEAVSGNYMLGSQIWSNFGNTSLSVLNPAVANVAAATASLPKTRAAMIYAESPLLGAANHIQLKTGNASSFILSSCGFGGRTIEELSKEYYNPVYYYEFTKLINSASAFNPTCPAIIFMQGEYNYTLPTSSSGLTSGSRPTGDKNAYKALFLKMKDNMQTDVMNKYNQTSRPLFITYQTGAQYTRGTTLAVGMAQLEATNENSDIICAGPVYPMTDRGGHLDSNGYRWFGEMLGKAYYQTKILGKPFQPLQPVEISRTDNPKVLKIRFHVPQLPLVFDDMLVEKKTSFGFEVLVNGAKKIIMSTAIENDCVLLTCMSDITGDVEVIYAGTNNSGHGNLRDSDNATAFYNYIDLDKKNQDGSFFYERDAAETTLRPSYEPRDSEGIIYNKPYPLYNFSVAFYYKLGAAETSYLIPNVPTSVNKNTINNDFEVNISDGKLQIKTSYTDLKSLSVLDLSGKVIAHFNHPNTERLYDLNLSKGVYLVNITSSTKNFSKKIIVK